MEFSYPVDKVKAQKVASRFCKSFLPKFIKAGAVISGIEKMHFTMTEKYIKLFFCVAVIVTSRGDYLLKSIKRELKSICLFHKVWINLLSHPKTREVKT
jgi:hypothetical protein